MYRSLVALSETPPVFLSRQPGYPPLLSLARPLIRRVSGGNVYAERSLAVVTMTTTS